MTAGPDVQRSIARAAHAAALLGTALMIVSMFLALLIAAAMNGPGGVPAALVIGTVGCVVVALVVALLACELDPYRPLTLAALTAVAGLIAACGVVLIAVVLLLRPTLHDVPFASAAAAVAGLVLAGGGMAVAALCVRAAFVVRRATVTARSAAFEPVMRAGPTDGDARL